MELVNHSNDSDLPLLCATSHSVTDLNRLQDKEPFLDKWASSGLSRGRMEMWERIYHSGGFLRASSAAVILDSQQCRLREPKSGPSLGSPTVPRKEPWLYRAFLWRHCTDVLLCVYVALTLRELCSAEVRNSKMPSLGP